MNRRIRRKHAKQRRKALERGFRATPEEMGRAAVEAARQIRRSGVLLRHRIKLPVYVAGPGDLVPILEMRAAHAPDCETADALRTAAEALRTRVLPDAIATLARMAADPSRSDEWRGQAAGCLEAARRIATEA